MDYHFYTRNDNILSHNNGLVATATNYGFDTVTIGSQTWSDYIKVDDGGSGIDIKDVGAMGTHYYYSWGAAERIAESYNGWHLPTIDDMNKLINYCNPSAGYKLKSVNYWEEGSAFPNSGRGCDLYGFNMLPLGNIWYTPTISYIGVWGWIWGYDNTTQPLYSDSRACLQVNRYENAATATQQVEPSIGAKIPFKLIKD